MAYSNAWDETAPQGSLVDANQLDDLIRQLKLDIRERMNTILAADGQWDDDPVKLAATPRTGLVLLLSGHAVQPENTTSGWAYRQTFFESASASPNDGRAPLPIRKDWKITRVSVLFDKSTDSSVTISFEKVTYASSPVTTVIDSATVSSSGIAEVEIFSGIETTDGASYYYLNFNGSASGKWRLYAIKVEYDEV